MARALFTFPVRYWLLIAFFFASAPAYAEGVSAADIHRQLAALEAASNGRLGVAAPDAGSGIEILYRAEKRNNTSSRN